MVDQAQQNILDLAEERASEIIRNEVNQKFAFHDLEHTQEVVQSVLQICKGFELSAHDKQLLLIAAWFHDTGYNEGKKQHEERSCLIATEFMQEHEFSKEDIETVCRCIMVTRMNAEPKDLMEQIMTDADLSHLGKSLYWKFSSKIRVELNKAQGVVMSELDWVNKELEFLEKHRYYTYVAHKLYDKRKRKHIKRLHKYKLQLNPGIFNDQYLADIEAGEKKKKKEVGEPISVEKQEEKPNFTIFKSNVEVMYLNSSRNHIQLSAIADNKANIMLSVNAIIISITLSTLMPQFSEDSKLIIPTFMLLVVCLISIVYATLSTRPKVTSGKFTRQDIDERNCNLLFFGNYYSMPLEAYKYGVDKMIKDTDFFHNSMASDLYFLGVVLAKKYRYLSITYAVFMYGLISTVAAFAIAYSCF